jgi:hypothetical protein
MIKEAKRQDEIRRDVETFFRDISAERESTIESTSVDGELLELRAWLWIERPRDSSKNELDK